MPEPVQAGDIRGVAAMQINKFLVVALTPGGYVLADKDEVSQKYRVAGISVTAADGAGSAFMFRQMGLVQNTVWAWTPGALLYLGDDGQLSETRGDGVVSQPLAVATTATEVLVLIDTPKQEVFVQATDPVVDHPALNFQDGYFPAVPEVAVMLVYEP